MNVNRNPSTFSFLYQIGCWITLKIKPHLVGEVLRNVYHFGEPNVFNAKFHRENILNQLHQFVKNRILVLVQRIDRAKNNSFNKQVETDRIFVQFQSSKTVVIN